MEENIKNEEIPFANSSTDKEQRDFSQLERKDLFRKLSIWERFLRWFVFKFRNKTLWKSDIGGFKYSVRRFWIDIRSIAKNEWNLRIGVNSHAYGYFLYVLTQMQDAEQKGDTATVESLKQHFAFYATNLNLASTFILSDKKFTSAIVREIDWSINRMMKKAAEEAKATTKEQEDTDEAFLQSAVERGNMTRQQRRKAQRDERKAMKKAIANDPLLRDIVNDKEKQI